ncbi:hypothetical protein GCM10022288_26500 [Gryllotalpicola kribbensis]|uniref:Uncharacterized protein n=1 Tax=Gryllotalpicola kribbensis TaxID=993084 RepID=A0ABP8AYY5_9MICO
MTAAVAEHTTPSPAADRLAATPRYEVETYRAPRAGRGGTWGEPDLKPGASFLRREDVAGRTYEFAHAPALARVYTVGALAELLDVAVYFDDMGARHLVARPLGSGERYSPTTAAKLAPALLAHMRATIAPREGAQEHFNSLAGWLSVADDGRAERYACSCIRGALDYLPDVAAESVATRSGTALSDSARKSAQRDRDDLARPAAIRRALLPPLLRLAERRPGARVDKAHVVATLLKARDDDAELSRLLPLRGQSIRGWRTVASLLDTLLYPYDRPNGSATIHFWTVPPLPVLSARAEAAV